MKKLSILFILLSLSFLQGLKAQRPGHQENDFLSVSDIHFNPFFDPSLIDTLVKSDVKQWKAIFESSSIKQPNGYGSDVNYPLLKSALEAMKQAGQHTHFMVISGDFLGHDFQQNFNKYVPEYPDALRSFTGKTIYFLAEMFDHYFPKTTVLPVLGNNDSYCGDYMLEPDGPFLKLFAQAWAPLQRYRLPSEKRDFIRQFAKGGYYVFPLKDGSGGQLVMLNTVFFSANYSNACGTATADPAGEQLSWLTATLKENTRKKKKSWLVYHIPPGINVHATLHGYGSCTDNIQLMWKETYNQKFTDLVVRYSSIIRANLAGHTHMDDFRVFYKGSKPVSFIHITPAVSPLFGNNPGFQHIKYNPRNFELINAETHYLSINKQAKQWTPEYNFQKTYHVKSINAMNLNTVRKRIEKDSVYLNKYIALYKVSNPNSNEITLQNWKAFWCGTGNLSSQSFAGCYCTTVPSK